MLLSASLPISAGAVNYVDDFSIDYHFTVGTTVEFELSPWAEYPFEISQVSWINTNQQILGNGDFMAHSDVIYPAASKNPGTHTVEVRFKGAYYEEC